MRSKQTLTGYRSVLVQFFRNATRQPPSYSRAEILEFLVRPCNSPRNRGGEPSIATRNWRLTGLSSFYRFSATFTVTGSDGVPRALMQLSSPTLGIPYGKVPRHPRGLSEDELSRLFSAIPDTLVGIRNRAIFAFFFWTGRRRSEVFRMLWRDIEPATLVDEDGSTRSGWMYWYYGKGKGQQRQAVELPKYAYIALERYLKASGRLDKMLPDDPLWQAVGPPSGGKVIQPKKPVDSGAVDYSLKEYARKAGIDEKRVSMHVFRHSAAQIRYRMNPDILKIQAYLGHESVASTMVYLEALVGKTDHAAKLLEERFKFMSDP